MPETRCFSARWDAPTFQVVIHERSSHPSSNGCIHWMKQPPWSPVMARKPALAMRCGITRLCGLVEQSPSDNVSPNRLILTRPHSSPPTGASGIQFTCRFWTTEFATHFRRNGLGQCLRFVSLIVTALTTLSAPVAAAEFTGTAIGIAAARNGATLASDSGAGAVEFDGFVKLI